MAPQEVASLYLAFIVQQPGVFESKLLTRFKLEFQALSVPPGACTAYSATNPAITGTAVISASCTPQELASGVKAGAAGNITTLTVLLVAQDPLPELPAAVFPQEANNT